MAGKGYSGSLPPARGPSALRKGELVHRRNAQKGCQRALCWPTSASGRAGNEGQKRGRAPPGGEADPSPPGPRVGAGGGQGCPERCPETPHGEEGAASVPGVACVHLRRQGHPGPKADPEGLLAANTHCTVAGGRGLCAGLVLPVPRLRPTAPFSGRFLPRGPDAARPAGGAQFTLSLSLHPWQPRERFSLLPSGHFSERSSGRAKASFVEESGVPGPGSSVTSHGDPPLRPPAGSHPGLEPS